MEIERMMTKIRGNEDTFGHGGVRPVDFAPVI